MPQRIADMSPIKFAVVDIFLSPLVPCVSICFNVLQQEEGGDTSGYHDMRCRPVVPSNYEGECGRRECLKYRQRRRFASSN